MKMKSKLFGNGAKLALAVLAVCGTLFTSCYEKAEVDQATKPAEAKYYFPSRYHLPEDYILYHIYAHYPHYIGIRNYWVSLLGYNLFSYIYTEAMLSGTRSRHSALCYPHVAPSFHKSQ